MGGDPWMNVVPYEMDINNALEQLKQKVFKNKEYRFPHLFPAASIEQLLEMTMDGGGTASAIDMVQGVSDDPQMFACAPLPSEILMQLYGTEKPTRRMLEGNPPFEEIERGYGYYVVLYDNDKPNGIWFGGYSWD